MGEGVALDHVIYSNLVYDAQGWINVVVAKQHYYHGLAQYKMGCSARDDKLFGQSIARMQVLTIIL